MIRKICIKTARIIVATPSIPTKAVWLVPGRPGYMVYNEDSTGRPETWKDPYCILCASHASQDHIDSEEHTDTLVAAANYLVLTGWGQIVAWLEQNAREFLEGGVYTVDDCASDHSVSGDVSRTIGVGPGGKPRTPSLKFQNWPFRDLEVDVSARNRPEQWMRMDPDMAEAIADGARNGDAVFEIVVGCWKNPWFYRFDFMAWTQTNLDTGTVRTLRLLTR